MQCEEDWLVMHALFAHHGWSISKIAREFGVDWRTARRYATAEVVPRYSPVPRVIDLSALRASGEVVEGRRLVDYEAVIT